MLAEINGDNQLTILERLRYLASNLASNLRISGSSIRRVRFSSDRLPRTPKIASPGRALTEAFLCSQMVRFIPPRKLNVLEIGCGSGSLVRLLAELGYSGKYVGVDIHDRFDRTEQPEFIKTFVMADANSINLDDQFDLIISISALEHIPSDHQLIERLCQLIAPQGVQLHVVPSGWGLPVYLWHGYRQYTACSLSKRFDPCQTIAYALGGGASFVLHFLFITFGEMLLRLHLRQRFPDFYGYLLDGCLRIDRLAPVCATMYAVCQSSVEPSQLRQP